MDRWRGRTGESDGVGSNSSIQQQTPVALFFAFFFIRFQWDNFWFGCLVLLWLQLTIGWMFTNDEPTALFFFLSRRPFGQPHSSFIARNNNDHQTATSGKSNRVLQKCRQRTRICSDLNEKETRTITHERTKHATINKEKREKQGRGRRRNEH